MKSTATLVNQVTKTTFMWLYVSFDVYGQLSDFPLSLNEQTQVKIENFHV